ncbi:hypothetical protein RB195_017576 [Necator americanus]|uniref:Uncharacterized protein n=1 Tax=Necator americanus TaxID=51031 RepID=A0ABR1C5V7_NECAM
MESLAKLQVCFAELPDIVDLKELGSLGVGRGWAELHTLRGDTPRRGRVGWAAASGIASDLISLQELRDPGSYEIIQLEPQVEGF